MRRFWLISLVGGVSLFALGIGMRVYAAAAIAITEQRLSAARPVNSASPLPPFTFQPADAAPDGLRLPEYNLWNTLEPVSEAVDWANGQLTWLVNDAGWHVPSGWPGWGSNVVVAGHSPSSDRAVWARSVFRQLAYLKSGDEVDLTAGHTLYRYRVSTVFSIPAAEAGTASAAAWLGPDLGERLTLVTCWPPNTAAYRVLVIAYPYKSELRGEE